MEREIIARRAIVRPFKELLFLIGGVLLLIAILDALIILMWFPNNHDELNSCFIFILVISLVFFVPLFIFMIIYPISCTINNYNTKNVIEKEERCLIITNHHNKEKRIELDSIIKMELAYNISSLKGLFYSDANKNPKYGIIYIKYRKNGHVKLAIARFVRNSNQVYNKLMEICHFTNDIIKE